MRVLGVSCTSTHAFLALVVDGMLLQDEPVRLEPAKSTDEDAALWETLKTCGDALDELKPDHIVLLLPETTTHTRQKHEWWRPRIEIETIVRMAASKREIPVDRVARATVRTALGVPAKGNFDTAIAPKVPNPGAYAGAGRLAAAAAALAQSANA